MEFTTIVCVLFPVVDAIVHTLFQVCGLDPQAWIVLL